MTFRPAVPLSGYAGWQFLQRTLEIQKQAFESSAPISRATNYFRENIANITSLDEFMADRQLVQVALGAFGLDKDVNSTAFIRKVLEEGSIDSGSFANRLSDKRYLSLSKAMGFGDVGGAGRTWYEGFPEEILNKYQDRQFELAVGETNEDMRLALNLSDGIDQVLTLHQTSNARWFGIMGSPPLRSVFETALGFSTSFGRIDIDQQRDQLMDRSKAVLGTDEPADFSKPEVQEKLIRLFLIRSEANAIAANGGANTALALVQSAAENYRSYFS
ncbi:DUF1217 domain-containing protein [Pelagovum pacificum]|uniref:DUF1217 domain-containing protein n=1 Tax=Pelagovum pacificum TaxID=2588711 RepID=A0A5C5GGJ0_9RHOB|nr:DUF1217 domain-containing protein [Pelagovum pacificum]QQA42986.1 DUF1217 domain-containing protein [Pelagovum pacificum]TNY33868.1 DUF1217 domain-containing protein [Pelagovum pacificum]